MLLAFTRVLFAPRLFVRGMRLVCRWLVVRLGGGFMRWWRGAIVVGFRARRPCSGVGDGLRLHGCRPGLMKLLRSAL